MPTNSLNLKPRILYLTQVGTLHDERFLIKLRDEGYPTLYVSLTGKNYVLPGGNRNIEVEGLPIHYLGSSGSQQSHNWSTHGEIVVAVWRLRRLIREFHPDILHAGFVTKAGLVAALSGFRPLLLMPWGSDILLYPGHSWLSNKLVRCVLKRADLITCDSAIVKNEILKLVHRTPDDIAVIPWGIDLDRFQSSDHVRNVIRHSLGWADAEILIMTRNLAPIYGVEDFIDALPSVFERQPLARALIIGEGPSRADLESKVSELGIGDKLRFLGRVPNQELPRYLSAADIYVSSSHSDGASLSLLEALSIGLPVVVTDLPAITDWVKHGTNGRVAPRGRPDLISAAIVELLNDPDARMLASTENRQLAKDRANWDDNFKILEEMYARLDQQQEAKGKS